MTKKSNRKLALSTETLRVLNPAHLRAAAGGTVLHQAPGGLAPKPGRDTVQDFSCTCI